MRTARLSVVLCAVVVSLFASQANAGTPVDAVKGRVYTITKQHGPWMIMVASISRIRDKENLIEGLSPREAALELVYQLRKVGIPAYVYEQKDELGRIETRNRLQEKETRVFAARRGEICVLAGNYPSPESSQAVRTLEYIKTRFDADFLIELGGRFKPTPGQPKPLSGAFLTVNPLLSPEEVKAASVDPLLVRLNSQYDNSLFENPGKYTLVIATFTGKSSRYVKDGQEDEAFKNFQVGNSLDKAAEDAFQLAESMRNATRHGYDDDFDVYVWHDRYKSVVTIGSFDDANDPRIARFVDRFGAKQKRLQNNPGQTALIAEYFAIPKAADITGAERFWLFDPKPHLMRVPNAHK